MFFLSVARRSDAYFQRATSSEALLGNKNIGLQEGEALEHPLALQNALERAQAQSGISMHFEVRKNLLKFDDVMNDQRKIVYEQRREIMEAETLDRACNVDMRTQVIRRHDPKRPFPNRHLCRAVGC
jgi:preprotein translocase subunit SecA